MELLDISRFRPPGFTRTSFHSTRAREFWQPHITRASAIVPIAEMVSVAEGLRECGTLHISPKDDKVHRRLAEAGLYWKQLTKVGNSQGFSHRRHAKVVDDNYTWFTVMGQSQESVDDWALAYERSNHRWMGSLLGFPDCCTEFFVKHWSTYCDPIWQAALNTEGHEIVEGSDDRRVHVVGHPGSNAMLRYIGARTTFHIPCSLNCEKSIAGSEKWLELVNDIDEKSALAVKYLLSLPLSWDVSHGWVKVMTPAFTVHAGSVESTKQHVVEFEPSPCWLPEEEIPGAVNGLVWPMRPGDMNKAPLLAAGGLSSE